MPLADLEVDNLRCIERAALTLHPRVNVLVGANGSGKTSLLEAIYLLGRGRSFRTRHTERLICHGADRLQVLGRLVDAIAGVVGVGCTRQAGVEARIDRRPVRSLPELAQVLPVQVLDPGIHRLIEEGPFQRRRWLDWGVFHVEPGFVVLWTSFSQALRQRNAALRSRMEASHWDPEIVDLGERLSQTRDRTLHALQPYLQEMVRALLPLPVAFGYFRGWSAERPLVEALQSQLPMDRERGTTLVGPHRFDITLRTNGRSVRDVLSRGQQKLLGAAMSLAMAKLIGDQTRYPATLLLDDPAAELDTEHTAALMQQITQLQGQLVVTALPGQTDGRLPLDRVFHVEQGRVTEVEGL